MAWLWVRSMFYLVAVGGVWLVLLPAGLLHCDPAGLTLRLRPWTFAAPGAAVFALGAMLALWSGNRLIRDGRGTPLPLDPTRRLVTAGPYAIVRNPQGIALILLTCGEVLAVDAGFLWMLPLLAILFLVGFAEPFEDWELRQRFGRAYDTYRARVPRWLPKQKAPRPNGGVANVQGLYPPRSGEQPTLPAEPL